MNMTPQMRNAINDALATVGHLPDRYDADAVYGALTERGIVILDPNDLDGNDLMADRCDFTGCDYCHPEDQESNR